MRTFFTALGVLGVGALAWGEPDRYVLVRCGTLLAVPGGEPVRDSTLVVKNGKVESVRPGLTGPELSAERSAGASVEEIDLRGAFVMPGLIDCHVHLTNQWNETVRYRATTESDSRVAVRSTMYARATLEAGFTTVRDLGAAHPQTIFALRDAIEAGEVVGPRILAAGHSITMTGGHGDNSLGYREDLVPALSPEDGVADGSDACVKAVRGQVKLGADVIKTTATGGVLSASSAGTRQHFFENELDAIVRTSHMLSRKTAAHAHGTDGINAALRAGVDSIEHGTYLDDESIRLFKEKGAYYVPTMLAGITVAENAKKPGYYLPMVAAKASEVGPRIVEAVRKAHGAGVKIAFGTDSGVSAHGENWREFGLLVSAGMTPMQTLESATVHAADLLGLSKEIGTLEAGKHADVVAVAGDPLRDVGVMREVVFVMQRGEVKKLRK
jgi:imidazolonepropionase-like amidohydrolase